MKTYQKILIHTNEENVDLPLSNFLNTHSHWIQGDDLPNNQGYTFIYKPESNQNNRILVLTRKKKKEFSLTRIKPQESGFISHKEYEEIAKKFGLEYRNYLKEIGADIKVHIPKNEINISHIITGEKGRDFFKKYILNSDITFHPNDDDTIDEFTTLLFKSNYKLINFIQFKDILVQNHKWTQDDADYLIDRIQIGLNVLKVYRNKKD